MAHHTVTLNYGNSGFLPDTDPLKVMTGDTISFLLGTAPPESRFQITMDDPLHFSVSQITDSNTRTTVLKAAETGYHCRLFDPVGNQISSESQAGGHVKPG